MRKLLVLAALVAVALVPAAAQAGPFIASDKVQVGDILSFTDYFNSNFQPVPGRQPDGWQPGRLDHVLRGGPGIHQPWRAGS